MKRYDKIGVFLTGAQPDQVALAFAGALAQRAGSQSLRCIGVLHTADDPQAHFPAVEEFTKQVHAALPAEIADRTTVEIHNETGVTEILRVARDDKLDLVIVGRRLPASQLQPGSAFSRLARKAPCSVLIVPVYAKPHLSRLLVPVDMSDHSRLAVEAALEIARSTEGGGQVLVQSIYSVGYGYHMAGVGLREAARNVERAAEKELADFVSGIDTSGVTFDTVCMCSELPAEAVRDMAAVRKMDLIVVGSRGASSTAAAFLGSTAERILHCAAQPVLIVKRKGETVSLLDALLGR